MTPIYKESIISSYLFSKILKFIAWLDFSHNFMQLKIYAN